MNGIAKFHSDQKGGPPKPTESIDAVKPSAPVSDSPKSVANNKTAMKNPYARKAPVNPYAKKAAASSSGDAMTASSRNPYAATKKTSPNKAAANNNKAGASAKAPPAKSATMLWVDKYKPQSSKDILGNQESVRKLRNWLDRWESLFNRDEAVGKAIDAKGKALV